MFLLKEDKQTTPRVFDQTQLDVKVTHGRSQLQEVRVVHAWSNPAFKWRLPKLMCQWFNKTDNSMELIAGVSDQVYQPSIIDVGTTLYIQIVPESKDLEYQGMPITRAIGPIQLASETQEHAKELLQAGKSTFFIELKELYLKHLGDEDQEAVDGKVPIKECLLKIANNKLLLYGKTKSQEKSDILLSTEVGSEYPQLQIDRSCSRYLNILFNSQEYAILILQNNKIRDIMFLLLRMLQEKITSAKEGEVQQAIGTASNPQQLVKNQQIIEIKDTKDNQKVDLQPKSQESLPLSPQSIQKEPYDSANLIIISELRSKLAKVENEYSRSSKELDSVRTKWQNAIFLSDTLRKDLQQIRNQLAKTQQELKILNQRKQKEQQQVCYLKNQCRILQQKNISQNREEAKLRQVVAKLQASSILSLGERQKFGEYSTLSLQQALQTILRRDQELEQLRMRNSYQQSQIDKCQEEIALAKIQLQEVEAINKHLTRKVESLAQSQSLLKEKASKSQKQQTQALNFLISKQKEEFAIQQAELEALQKDRNSIKLQVRELIQQNTCLRSKEKSSKHQLKLQVVELKKLVNRFTEMITEKDIEIGNLKLTNKTLNNALLQYKK